MIILPPDDNKDNNSSNPDNVSIPSNPPRKKEMLHNTTTSDTKAKNTRNSKGKNGTCKNKAGGNPANPPTASQTTQRGLVSDHDSGITMTPTKNQKPSQQTQRKKEDYSKSPQQVDQFPSSPSSASPRSEARPTHSISSRSLDFMAEEGDEIHSRHANDTISSRPGPKGVATQWHPIDSMLFDGTEIGINGIDDIHDGTMVGDSILCGRWDVSNDNNDSNNIISNNTDNNTNKCNGGEDNQQPGTKSTRNNYTHTSASTTAIKIYSTRGNSEDITDNEGVGVAATTSAPAKVARSRPTPAPGNNPDFDRFGLDSGPAGADEKDGKFGHASDTVVWKENMVDAPRSFNSKAGLVPSFRSSTQRIRNFKRFSLSTKSSSSPVISSSSSPPPPSDFPANAYSYSKIHKAAANDTDSGNFKAAIVNDAKYDGFSSSNGRCKRISDNNERIHGFSGGCWKGGDIAFADDMRNATDGSNKPGALPKASEAMISSDRPSSSCRSTVKFLPIIYFQQRMIYPDGFFTQTSTSKHETLSSKALSNMTSSLIKNSTSQADPTQSTPIQTILSKWKVYTNVTEFGFDCYVTPKYILPDGGGGDNARGKYDGNGCVGWGSNGSIVGGQVASESTSRTSSSLSEPPSKLDGNPRWYDGDNLSVVNVPTASPSVTVAEEVNCDHRGMKAEVALQPPGHIYALREICFDGQITGVIGSEVTEGGEERYGFTADLPSDSSTKDQQRGRIITSRVVCTTENIHLQLEQSSAGTALCPAWKNDDSGSIISGHIFKLTDCGYGPFFYSTGLMPSEGIPPMESRMKPPGRLLLVTVPLSEFKRQMGGNINSSDASLSVDKMDSIGRKNFSRCQYLDNEHFMGVELIDSIRAIDHAFQVSDECTPKDMSSAKSDKKKRWRHPRKLLKSIAQFRRRNKHGKKASDIDDTRLSICGVAPGNVSSSAKSTSDLTKLRGKQNSTDKSLDHGVNGSHVPRVIHYFNHGARIFSDEAILNNKIEPIAEIVCISHSLGIYVCESGLSASECQHIIDVSEACATSAHGWSSYTYAKQTLGCREHDMLAFASKKPVMTACATIGKYLLDSDSECSRPYDPNDTDHGTYCRQESARPLKEKAIVLDAREPHIVKYDLSKKERQKLDMHTDKSIWTFLIALSEGRGYDYSEGGTFFEALNSTVHLQRGQMLIFRGKLRHRGVKISFGTRYLLVGFLVEKKNGVGVAGGT